jgi:hypothetical protein
MCVVHSTYGKQDWLEDVADASHFGLECRKREDSIRRTTLW